MDLELNPDGSIPMETLRELGISQPERVRRGRSPEEWKAIDQAKRAKKKRDKREKASRKANRRK